MIKYIKAQNIAAVSHGFFTNEPLATDKEDTALDFSFSNFQTDTITIDNRRLAAISISKPDARLIFADQIHSSKVTKVSFNSKSIASKADGLVTSTKGIALCILTADCLPILFHDPSADIIGATHAGWRGALAGIAEATIDSMVQMGALKANITVALGPCISKENYEVDKGFMRQFTKDSIFSNKFFKHKHKTKYLFDLSSYTTERLHSYGVKNISTINVCTYSQNNSLHSYRYALQRNQPSHKRNISIISL